MSEPASAAPAHEEPAGETYNPVFEFIVRRAGWVLTIVAALTVAALTQLIDLDTGKLRLRIDPSLDPLVAQDDPGRIYYEQVRRRFGNDETVLVVMQVKDVYSPDALRRLDRLTQALEQLPGVAEVDSLTTASLARFDEGAAKSEIHFERLQAEELDDPDLPARLRKSVAANPLVRGQLVSADGRAAAVVVSLEAQSEGELLDQGLIQNITAAADAEQAEGVELWVTGAPVIRVATSEAVLRQLRWVVPAIVVLLTGLLALGFRTVRGVLLPLATIFLALVWTLATLCVLGRPLNLITSLVPPLLITMGLAYCAHVISEFEALPPTRRPGEPQSRVAVLLQEVAAPVMLTGFTTVAGLLALLLNGLPAIQEFAWLSALGVFFTAVLVLSFVPAVLSFASPRDPKRNVPGHHLFQDFSRWLGQFDTRRRKTILIVAGIVFLLAVAAAARIRIGDQFVGIFPPESRVRADYEAVNRAIGGVNPLSIVIDAAPDSFTDPAILRELEKLESWLAAQPEVGAVSGLVDHVQVLNIYLGAGLASGIPASREMVKQLLFFGDSQLLSDVVDTQRSSTRIELRLRVDDTAAIHAFLERLQPRLAELPQGFSAQVTGNAVLLTQSVQTVTAGQIRSVGLALLLIYLCLAVQFASWSIGLLAALPTALQTALYFGALGLSGVTLNATTSLVECLVLGLAVDDTIHYLARFNTAARRSGSESAAAVSALSSVLRPVTLTKGILAIGFLMLATGELRNQVLFGWLAALTLFSAWLVDIFVTPAFMSGVRIITLWDSLRLDLGRNVQATIPLFTGLSTRQARIFALMSKLQVVPAGTRIMSEGDPAGDVYVVIDGELSVWVERDSARLDLNMLRRGAVVGEGGYFGQKRNANVDALTRVRLLRFDDADQERVCRRFPKIAARVFLNMNKIQAERRAAQVQQQMH